jgi:hypothetical protein
MFQLQNVLRFLQHYKKSTDNKGFQTYWQPGGVEAHSQDSLDGWKHTYLTPGEV